MSEDYNNLDNTDNTSPTGQVKDSNLFCGASSDSSRNINDASAAPLDLPVHRVIHNSFSNNTFDNDNPQSDELCELYIRFRDKNNLIKCLTEKEKENHCIARASYMKSLIATRNEILLQISAVAALAALSDTAIETPADFGVIDKPPSHPPILYRTCNMNGSRCNPDDYVETFCSSHYCWRLPAPLIIAAAVASDSSVASDASDAVASDASDASDAAEDEAATDAAAVAAEDDAAAVAAEDEDATDAAEDEAATDAAEDDAEDEAKVEAAAAEDDAEDEAAAAEANTEAKAADVEAAFAAHAKNMKQHRDGYQDGRQIGYRDGSQDANADYDYNESYDECPFDSGAEDDDYEIAAVRGYRHGYSKGYWKNFNKRKSTLHASSKWGRERAETKRLERELWARERWKNWARDTLDSGPNKNIKSDVW